MTDRFKKAVKEYVSDCKLTQAEKDELLVIAKEDGININDAIIYMNSELKKRISKGKNKKETIEILKNVGEFTLKAVSVAITVLGAVTQYKEHQKKK